MELGRKLVNAQIFLLKPIQKKWHDFLPKTFLLNWNKIWTLWMFQKESWFIWSLYHKVIVRLLRFINSIILVILVVVYTLKKLFHTNFVSNQARHLWSWALTIKNKLRCNPSYFEPWMGQSINQCLFDENLHKNLSN